MLRNLTTVMTANGEVQTREEATENVKELDLFVTVMLLAETPAVLSLGKLCEDHGYSYHWTSGQKPHLTQNGKKIDWNTSNYVPFVVLGLSTSSCTSFTPTSSTFSSHDSVIGTENPAAERSEIMSAESRGNPLPKPAKNKTQIKMKETKTYSVIYCLSCWTGLQEFRENLVDESSPLEPQGDPSLGHRDTSSSSHELPMESRPKVETGWGKHCVYTHFPKDPNCDICLKTKITRGVLPKTCWYIRTQSGTFW